MVRRVESILRFLYREEDEVVGEGAVARRELGKLADLLRVPPCGPQTPSCLKRKALATPAWIGYALSVSGGSRVGSLIVSEPSPGGWSPWLGLQTPVKRSWLFLYGSRTE